MPRITFISALSISIILIGGAMWFRFFQASPPPAQIVSVSQVEPFLTEETSIADFLGRGDSPRTGPATPLSPTEAIGRQLFSDYMSLRSEGALPPGYIGILADKYAEGIGNFEVSIPKVNTSQIIVLPDSEENLKLYGNTMVALRNKYKNLVALQAENRGGSMTDFNSLAFSSFMGAIAQLYQSSTEELLAMGVPSSLAQNHVDLINHYLESTEIMGSLSNAAQNSVKAYSALNIYTQRTGKEAELLLNIQEVLMSNGVILNSSL